MIAFKYTKTDGAEFISHLDTLRHLNKIFLRGDIPVKESQGYHPHMLVYMSSPIPLGLKSMAEFCTVDADMDAAEFLERFNRYSPRGIKCLWAENTDKNPNFAAIIDRARYYIEGLADIPEEAVAGAESFTVIGKKGEERDVRDKIYSFKKRGGGYEVLLAAGNASLRPDLFADALKTLYGGGTTDILKEESFAGDMPAEDALWR